MKILSMATLCIAIAAPALAKKSAKTVTTVDGKPVRAVYIRTASADMAAAAAARLTQDTCITVVSTPQLADAVLDVGIALPSVGGGLPQPDLFGPAAQPQTLGNLNQPPERNASSTCSDDQGKQGKFGCSDTTSPPAGDLAAQPASVPEGAGANLDVSLASPGSVSQELWEAEPHSKKSWSDQLRVAVGCPVCSEQHYDRHKYKTYQDWIQAMCPSVSTE